MAKAEQEYLPFDTQCKTGWWKRPDDGVPMRTPRERARAAEILDDEFPFFQQRE